MAAYDGIKDGLQVILYLSVPPNTIDINIHPTKTELNLMSMLYTPSSRFS
jgi:DNA mismatch repair protein MutL